MLQVYQSAYRLTRLRSAAVTKGEICIMKQNYESELGEYITIALLQLMQKKSYFQITITEICRKAGVSRMSFYRCFDSKLDVLRQRISEVTDAFVAASGISYRKNSLKKYFTTLFRHFLDNRESAALLHRDGLLYIVKNDIDRVFFSTYQDVYEEYKLRFISGGIFDVYRLWLENGCKESPEEMAERLSAILER